VESVIFGITFRVEIESLSETFVFDALAPRGRVIADRTSGEGKNGETQTQSTNRPLREVSIAEYAGAPSGSS